MLQHLDSCHLDRHADTLKGHTCTYCREFVVNIISHWMLEAANVTCGDYSHNESEWDVSTLTPIPAVKVRDMKEYDIEHLACFVNLSGFATMFL